MGEPIEQEPLVEQDRAKFSKALDYKAFVGNAPSYRYLRKTQQTGSETLSLPVASSTTAVFELPADIYNFSKSRLTFSLRVDFTGTTIFYNMDFPPIERIVLKTRNGKELVDIREFRDYWMMVKDHQTPVHKLDGKGSYATDEGKARSFGLTTWNNACQAVVGLYNANPVDVDAKGSSGTGLRQFNTGEYQLVGTVINTVQPTHTANLVSDGSDIFLHCCLNFDKLYDTLLSVDRNLPLVEACNLEVTFAPSQLWSFSSDAETTPAANPAIPTAESAISKLALYLAVEQDDYNRTWTNAEVNRVHADGTMGISLAVPYVHVITQAIPAQTTASIQFKLNKGHGQRLLRIYSSQKVPDAKGLNCVHSDFKDIETHTNSTIYHLLDSKRLEDEDLDETYSHSFYHMQPIMEGSLAHYNGARYFYSKCPSHVADWSACGKLINASEANLLISGKDLTKELLFNRVYRLRDNVAQTAIFVVVTQKTLNIDPTGLYIE